MNDLINSTLQKNKKLYISIGLFLGSFGIGYLVWKTFNYYKRKKLSHHEAEKFINENKELFKEGLDSKNKLDEVEEKDTSTEIKQQEIKVEEKKEEKEQKEEIKTEIKEEFYDEKLMNDLLKKIRNIIVFSIMREMKYMELNKEKILDKIQFKSEVIYTIEFSIQNTLVKEQINYDLFLKSHNHYFNNNSDYKEKWIFLNTLKLSILTSDTVNIEFPEEIKNNFLKIVSNIFFVNLYKTWKDFKSEFLLLDNHSVPKKIVDTLYQKNLKQTRREVYEFFKVPQNKIFDSKNYVRLYPFSLPYKDPVKIDYLRFSDEIDKLCENMNHKIIPELFLKECEDSNLFKIRDEIIDLNSLITKCLDYSLLTGA